jgi:hypothetical protein
MKNRNQFRHAILHSALDSGGVKPSSEIMDRVSLDDVLLHSYTEDLLVVSFPVHSVQYLCAAEEDLLGVACVITCRRRVTARLCM